MHNQKLILFDFDGVIIDGINEYWLSSLLACQRYLHSSRDFSVINTEMKVSKTFIQIRPWVKFGWEMVLITNEIIKENNPLTQKNKNQFLENYKDNCKNLLIKNSWTSKRLQDSLDKARITQIEDNLMRWISLHTPFIEVVEFIQKVQKDGYKIGIISTKAKLFTSKILEEINILPEFIFGYESGNKIEITLKLLQDFKIEGFVEDRRATLINIINNHQTKDIPCYLANWGYLKNSDRINLPHQIKLLTLNKLEDILAN